MAETKTDWYFIINPRAGSGKTMSSWIPAEKLLDSIGIPYETAYTDHKRHATALAKEAAANGYRRIAAVGGDGSLHEVFNGICQWCDETGTPTEEFYMGVAPIGSGNDWIKSLELENDVEESVKLMAAGSFGQMDVVKVKSVSKYSYMANIGGLGFDSHVCKRVNIQKESGMRNKFIYLNALRYTMFSIKSINIRVCADGEVVFSGPAYSVALGNGKYSGGGMRQVPDADINDNLIDFTIVPKAPLYKLVPAIPMLFNGKLKESPLTVCGRCKRLEIMPMDEKSDDIIELDGEIEGRIPLLIEMSGRKINVIKR